MILTGKQICSLMRCSRVRIRDLAVRMQITQKRIRYVREHGIADGNAARDWIEAITGDERPRVDSVSLQTVYRISRRHVLLRLWQHHRPANAYCSRRWSSLLRSALCRTFARGSVHLTVAEVLTLMRFFGIS